MSKHTIYTDITISCDNDAIISEIEEYLNFSGEKIANQFDALELNMVKEVYTRNYYITEGDNEFYMHLNGYITVIDSDITNIASVSKTLEKFLMNVILYFFKDRREDFVNMYFSLKHTITSHPIEIDNSKVLGNMYDSHFNIT